MELGIHPWMRSATVETTIRRFLRWDIPELEIAGTPEQYDTKSLRALMKAHGLSCWGAVTLVLGDRNLLARDEAQRAKSVQYVKDIITMVKELDGHMVSCCTLHRWEKLCRT